MTSTNEHNRIVVIALVIVGLLSIPLIAMQFDTGVNWDLTDFVVMGILLSIVGIGYETIARTAGDTKRRIIYTGLLLLVFLYVWAELAVGILNIPGISGS